MTIEQFLDNLLLHHQLPPSTRKRIVRFMNNPSEQNAELLVHEEQTEQYAGEWSNGPNIDCYADKHGW